MTIRLCSPLLTLAIITVAMPVVAEAKARPTAKIYTCHFPKSGTVIIDTREPKASITVGSKRYPAHGGAYFYQSVDGDIAVMFGPGVIPKFWEYEGERDTRCRRS